MFKPRNPNVQDAQLTHDEASGPASAGCVVYLAGDQQVACVSASGHAPFGFLGQDVLAEASNLPKGFRFPGQLGSSDAFLGEPVMVAHSEGTYETTHYVAASGVGIDAGDSLYAVAEVPADNGKLSKDSALGADGGTGNAIICATAMASLTADEAAANKPLLIKLEL